jgi:hypothetical protein
VVTSVDRLERVGEEPMRGRQIPFLRGEDVDDLAELVDRPVQVNPPTGDFDVCLIDKPPIFWDVSARPRGVDEQRGEPLPPAIDGDVIHLHAPLPSSSSTSRYDKPQRRYLRTAIVNHIRREPESGEARPRHWQPRVATTHQHSLARARPSVNTTADHPARQLDPRNA